MCATSTRRACLNILWIALQISREEKENQAKVVEREVKAAVSKVTAAYEERLSSVRAEHSLKIQQGNSHYWIWKRSDF